MDSCLITQKHLKSILDYDPETGIFIWRERPLKHFKNQRICNMWNTRFAGKSAGSLDSNGYIRIKMNSKSKLAHILVYIYMIGKYPNEQIDHDNGNSSDNRWINLRLANKSQNRANSKVSKNNTSGYKGVHFSKNAKKWQSTIVVNKKRIHLGLFSTPQEAHEAYCSAGLKYFGKFARFE